MPSRSPWPPIQTKRKARPPGWGKPGQPRRSDPDVGAISHHRSHGAARTRTRRPAGAPWRRAGVTDLTLLIARVEIRPRALDLRQMRERPLAERLHRLRQPAAEIG